MTFSNHIKQCIYSIFLVLLIELVKSIAPSKSYAIHRNYRRGSGGSNKYSLIRQNLKGGNPRNKFLYSLDERKLGQNLNGVKTHPRNIIISHQRDLRFLIG
uniref:Uncharacterized protein n=1 Tax=Strongyloides venezuelensis TaxID=75913 RepID=A0A0K0FZJ3_STRVS